MTHTSPKVICLRDILKGYVRVMFRVSMKVVIECMYLSFSSFKDPMIEVPPSGGIDHGCSE